MTARPLKPLTALAVATLALLALAPLGQRVLPQRTALLFAPAAWVAIVLSLGAGCALVLLSLRARRPLPVGALALVAWWLAVEQLAAPHLVLTLRLHQLPSVRDPDHRPTNVGPDWNSDHLRGTPEREAFADADLNLLVLGDSFTFGHRVRAAEAFPALVGETWAARHPGLELRVANFGWISSSPLLSWRRLVDLGDGYRPDLVLLAVDMTDFGDDIRWRHMLARDGAYALYDRLPIALRLFQALSPELYRRAVTASVGGGPSERYFASEHPLAETRRWCDELGANLARIEAWCRARGAQFAVVVLPRHFQYDARECPDNWEAHEYTLLGPWSLEPFRWFDELRAAVDYPVVSLLDDFRDSPVFPKCFVDDPHWTPAGHALAAEAIARRLGPWFDARAELLSR